MSTRLKASLEEVIEKWTAAQCEADDWPSIWIYENLVPDMATAAFLVFLVCKNSQEFAIEQERPSV